MTDDCVHSPSQRLMKGMAEASASGDGVHLQMRPTLRLKPGPTPPASPAEPSEAPETDTTQSAGSQPSAQLLALAELMEGWAAGLPRWDSQVTEPWFVFLERAYKAETALAERLGRLRTCRLVMCPVREQVSLRLARISVSSDQGLAAACRTWAQKARAQSNS